MISTIIKLAQVLGPFILSLLESSKDIPKDRERDRILNGYLIVSLMCIFLLLITVNNVYEIQRRKQYAERNMAILQSRMEYLHKLIEKDIKICTDLKVKNKQCLNQQIIPQITPSTTTKQDSSAGKKSTSVSEYTKRIQDLSKQESKK